MFGGGHRTSVGLSYTESRHDNVDIYHLFLWIVTIKCENFPNNFIGFHNLFINVEIILKVIGASYTDFSEGNVTLSQVLSATQEHVKNIYQIKTNLFWYFTIV